MPSQTAAGVCDGGPGSSSEISREECEMDVQKRVVVGSCLGGLVGIILGGVLGLGVFAAVRAAHAQPPPREEKRPITSAVGGFVGDIGAAIGSMVFGLAGACIGGILGAIGGSVFGASSATGRATPSSSAGPDSQARPGACDPWVGTVEKASRSQADPDEPMPRAENAAPEPESAETEMARLKRRMAELERIKKKDGKDR
jgi:hypothetical protein